MIAKLRDGIFPNIPWVKEFLYIFETLAWISVGGIAGLMAGGQNPALIIEAKKAGDFTLSFLAFILFFIWLYKSLVKEAE